MFRSSEIVELTESETEYVVRCIKHCYTSHLVLQFDCLNTLSDQLLENVHVQIDPSDGYQVVKEVACPKLPYNETGAAYVVLLFPDDLGSTVASFGAILQFTVKDCDPTTGLPDSNDGKHENLDKRSCCLAVNNLAVIWAFAGCLLCVNVL